MPSKGKYRGTVEYYLVLAELIRAAQYGGLTTYQAIAQIMGLTPTGGHMAAETGHILGEVSEDELERGRPMVSALAVGVSGRPGEGFFKLARELGRLQSEKPEDEQRFWKQEREALYKTWKRRFKV